MTRAQLFVSCMVDLFRPRAGIAAVQVLERRGVELEFPAAQTCCGQFAYNAGHHREAAERAGNCQGPRYRRRLACGRLGRACGSCRVARSQRVPQSVVETIIGGGRTGLLHLLVTDEPTARAALHRLEGGSVARAPATRPDAGRPGARLAA